MGYVSMVNIYVPLNIYVYSIHIKGYCQAVTILVGYTQKGVDYMGNSIFVPQDYGKVIFSFDKVMDEKKINRNQLSQRAGIRFEVADRFYSGQIERLDIDVLARVCFVLECNISDVMSFQL